MPKKILYHTNKVTTGVYVTPSPIPFHRILYENIIIMLILKNIDYKIYFCCHIYVTTHQEKWMNIACQICKVATGIFFTTPTPYIILSKIKKLYRLKFIFVLRYMLLHIRQMD